MSAERVREMREAVGLTQAQLAGCVGISREWLNQFERGRVNLTDERLERIEQILRAAVARHVAALEATI